MDFFVEFELPTQPGIARRYFGLEADLGEALGRKVEMSEMGAIRDPYVLASIERDRETVYVAPS